MVIRCWQCLLVLFVLVRIGPFARAEADLLTVQLQVLSRQARTSSPIVLDCHLDSRSSTLLEGQLVISAHDGRELFAQFHVNDLVLTTGPQTVRTVLPALDSLGMFEEVELRLTFEGEQQTIDLGRHSLRLGTRQKRSLVVCLCDDSQNVGTDALNSLADSFRFERYLPQDSRGSVISTRVRVESAAMPVNPLACCAFDVVVLSETGFRELRGKQLDALDSWVQAGGSLCVFADGSLEAYHVRFLNQLASARSNETMFSLNSAGRLASHSADEADEVHRFRNGLGRVVVVAGGVSDNRDFEAPAWRLVAAYLWKVRQDQLAAVVEKGEWDFAVVEAAISRRFQMSDDEGAYPQREYWDNQLKETLTRARETRFEPTSMSGMLLSRMMPKSVRLVPWSLIAFVLFLYVLAIGPGDYFLLGHFKLRRFTWLVFPAVTVGFALFALAISNRYLKTADIRSGVVILDVGENGEIVRTNRFDLLFSGRPKELTTDVTRSLFSQIRKEIFSNPMQNYAGRYARGPNVSFVGPIQMTGRMPTQYQVTQQLQQWAPRLNRLLSFVPPDTDETIRWDRIDPRMATTEQGRRALKDQVVNTFGRDALCAVYHLSEDHQITIRNLLFHVNKYDPHSYGYHYSAIPAEDTSFIREISTRTNFGLFSLVSQVSPTGGDNFEDLPVMDPSDPRQWLLVVTVPEGRDLLIYRKLYFGDE